VAWDKARLSDLKRRNLGSHVTGLQNTDGNLIQYFGKRFENDFDIGEKTSFSDIF
jgi:hypothetical protein